MHYTGSRSKSKFLGTSDSTCVDFDFEKIACVIEPHQNDNLHMTENYYVYNY